MADVRYAESFFRAAKRLQKRYPHVEDDAEMLADRLEAGELPGDRIPGLADRVYKVRIPNRDARRGKRGGYRVIYYLQTTEAVVIITIYSKSEKSDIPLETIRQMIKAYEQSR